jgi:hypothetical protein
MRACKSLRAANRIVSRKEANCEVANNKIISSEVAHGEVGIIPVEGVELLGVWNEGSGENEDVNHDVDDNEEDEFVLHGPVPDEE